MAVHKLGVTVEVEFTTTQFSSGAAFSATGTPVGTISKNGIDDGLAVTVTLKDVGRYKAVFTPTTGAGFAVGDDVSLSIAATVDAVAAKGIIWQAVLVSEYSGELDATTITAIQAGLSTFDHTSDAVDVDAVAGAAVVGVDDFKANVSSLSSQASVDAIGLIIAALSSQASVDAIAIIVAELSTQVSVDAVGVIVTAIQVQTDKMNFSGADIKCTLDGETVSVSAMSTGVVTQIVTGVFAKVVDGTKTFKDVAQLVNAVFRGAWSYDSNLKLLTVTNEDGGTTVWDFSVTNTRTTS